MKRTVLLDIDGTLVDSNTLHAEAWQLALRQFGFEVALDTLQRMIGMGGDKLLPQVTKHSDDSPLGKQISAARSELFVRDFIPRVRALPGARDLVERIIDRGHHPVVASSAKARELGLLLQRANVADLLPLRTGSDDAENSKPDPDIVQAALRKAGAAPHEAVLIGDTPYDLKAAARINVGFIGVRSGGWDDHSLRGALAIYDDAAALCAAFDQSPIAR